MNSACTSAVQLLIMTKSYNAYRGHVARDSQQFLAFAHFSALEYGLFQAELRSLGASQALPTLKHNVSYQLFQKTDQVLSNPDLHISRLVDHPRRWKKLPASGLHPIGSQYNHVPLSGRSRVSMPFRRCFGKRHSALAQLVEQMTVNHWVAGSSPAGGAKFSSTIKPLA